MKKQEKTELGKAISCVIKLRLEDYLVRGYELIFSLFSFLSYKITSNYSKAQ